MVTLNYEEKYRKGRIITSDKTLEMIRKKFSETIPNIGIIRIKANNPYIPGRNYAIPKTGLFDFGLCQEISEFLKDKNIPVEFTESFIKQRDCGFSYDVVFDGLKIKHRDYGLDAVTKALDRGWGTIVSGTGSGKSMMTASLIENIILTNTFDKFKCIILVPGLSLVDQLVENFEEYGVSFTYSGWTGKQPLQNTDVVVCNTENFCANFDKNKWICDVDVFVGDEAHKIKDGSKVTKHISQIKTRHKYGFTGTLSKNQIDRWKTIGTFGPIIFEKQSKELRDEGFLTNANIKIVKLIHSNFPKMDYKRELQYVYNSPARHILVKKIASKLNNNTLILVNHIEHGTNTLNMLRNLPDKEVFFVNGGMPVKEREEIVRKMETQTNIICIAMSSIFSTGINIKNLHYILFIAGGKSFIRVVQSIGRGLRLHDSKNKLTLFDICDNLRYSMEHSDKRKEFYDLEQIEWKEIEIFI